MTLVMMRGHVTPLASGGLSDQVHPAVARLHFGSEQLVANGRFNVRRGSSVAARLACAVTRLPASAHEVGLDLRIEREGKQEVWRRSFAGRSLDASFERDEDERLVEGFGPLRLSYQQHAKNGALILNLVAAHLRFGPLSIRLPRWASPRVRARAWVRVEDDLLRACIVVLLPWGKLLLAYRGFLVEVQPWTR